MARITADEFDEVMVARGAGHREAPRGMDGELHRLMPGLTQDQRTQLMSYVLYIVKHSEPDVGKADKEAADHLLAFTVGVEIGQEVGRLEGSRDVG